MGGGGSNAATFSVTVADDTAVLELSDSLRQTLTALPDAGDITVSAGAGGGGFSASAVRVIVQADDPDTLPAAAEQVREAVAGTPDVVDVTSDLANSTPRIDVKVDRQAAAAAGPDRGRDRPGGGRRHAGHPAGPGDR